MSKYNEVMENIVVTDEMRARILQNIEKEAGTDNSKENSGNINEKSTEEERPGFQKINISDYEKKKDESSSGKIVKFIMRYGSKVAVFALVMLGAYGVISLVGISNKKALETSAPAQSTEMAMESTDNADEAEYANESEAVEDAEYANESEATEKSDYAYKPEAIEEAAEYAPDSADNAYESETEEAAEYEAAEGTVEYAAEPSVDADSLDESGALEGNSTEDRLAMNSGKSSNMLTGEASTDGLRVVMAGDVLLHTPVAKAGEDENGDYDFDFIFRETKDEISDADIAIVNQEVILGGKELGVTGYPSFNAPYELGDSLVKTGFDVICHATNHALDKGKKGIVNACEFWKTNYPDITIAGINETREEYDEVRIVEKNGIKVAVLNYTYGTNGISLPSDMPFAVNLLEEDKVIADLEYAEENADFTIVCPHWGTEYSHGINSDQEKWTKVFREYGADLVIGTHPHVIEPIELLEDDNKGITNNHGNGDMLVYYSIGNFVNWTSDSGKGIADRMVGGLADVSLKRDENGEVCIDDYGVKALISHVESGHENVKVYPLSDYSDANAKKNEIAKQDSAFTKEYCEKLCDDVWGDLWK